MHRDRLKPSLLALLAGALFVLLILLQPALIPHSAYAQSGGRDLYIEPGTISIRNPAGGGTAGDGKMVVNLRTGEVWGFPTNLTGSPYPVDPIHNAPPVVTPIYLGRFDFSSINKP